MIADDTNVRPFDFRKPCRLPVEIEAQLRKWQEDVCAYAPEILRPLLRSELSCKPLPLETVHPSDALNGTTFVAFRVRYQDHATNTLLAFDLRLAKTLVSIMLQGEAEEEPDDRPVTDIEQALLEMLAQQWLQAIGAVSPEGVSCNLQLQSFIAQPRLNLFFPADQDLIVLRYEVGTSPNPGQIAWIWTEGLTEKLFDGTATDVDAEQSSTGEVQDVAMRIRFDVTVRLGSARLHVSELANLREGDVIVLDQRVSDTMPAFVDERCIFHGWPGRVGNRQAFQVESVHQES